MSMTKQLESNYKIVAMYHIPMPFVHQFLNLNKR